MIILGIMKTDVEHRADYIELAVSQIGERYSRLRVVDPRSEAAMARSMLHYGQLSPVMVGKRAGGGCEMIDGFKRLRAARRLKWPSLYCRVLAVGTHALKAAMIHLNMEGRTIADLEKGMVIHSLHREDKLSQVQIAELLGRHRSWVCRRLSLVERLSDEVLENLKLGLITTTTGRELAKLPRGNQDRVLKSVLEHRMTARETAGLVPILLREPKCNHEKILSSPKRSLCDGRPVRPVKKKQTPSAVTYGALLEIERVLKSEKFGEIHFSRIDQSGFRPIQSAIRRIRALLTGIDEIVNRDAVFEKGADS